jgi:hypothetical protein
LILQAMSSGGESDAMTNTGQRKPTLLRECSTRRPAEHVKHMLIAVVDVGEIHGQIPGTGVQDRAELGAESLRGVVIKVTLHGHAGVPGATPHNGDRLLG